MPSLRTCAECGAPIPPDARESLCPRCLLGLGLQAGVENPAPGSRSADQPPQAPPADDQGLSPAAAKPAASLPVDEELEGMLKSPRLQLEPVYPKAGYLFAFAGGILFEALKAAGQQAEPADVQRAFEDGCSLCLRCRNLVAWAFDLDARNERSESGRSNFVSQAAFPKKKQPATDGVTVVQQILVRGVSEIMVEKESCPERPPHFYQVLLRKKIGWLVAGLMPPLGLRKRKDLPQTMRAEGVNRQLEVAALNGEVEVVRRLLESGVSPDGVGGKWNDTPLSAAALNARLRVVHLLLEWGANPDGMGGSRPPLCEVSRSSARDQVKVIQALLEAGANPNCRDQNEMTPLMIAVHNPEAVALLLEHGARLTDQDDRGLTALLNAALNGRVESLRILLAAGAGADQVDRAGRGALHLAAYRFQAAALQVLISSGLFDVNAGDHEGLTPLHVAAGVALRARSGFMMRLAPDALTVDQQTATAQHRELLDRLESQALPAVDVLMAAGADMNLKDRCGRSPLQVAEQEEFWEIRARLLQNAHGGKGE